MARQRRNYNMSKSDGSGTYMEDDSYHSATKSQRYKYTRFEHDRRFPSHPSNNWCPRLMFTIAASCIILAVLYFLYLGYMETRINTPLSAPKVVISHGLSVPERYWGTYRPGVYFGTRTRHMLSLLTGMMWFVQGHFQNNMLAIRHWCDQGDKIPKYGWEMHDGRYFGSQKIIDKYVIIKTDFVKRMGGHHGGDWTVRIHAFPRSSKTVVEEVSLLYYCALDPEDEKGFLHPLVHSSEAIATLTGFSESVGHFHMHFLNESGYIKRIDYLSTRHLGFNLLKETVVKGLKYYKHSNHVEDYFGLVGEHFAYDDHSHVANFVVFQLAGKPPFTVDVIFESGSFFNRQERLSRDVFSTVFSKYVKKFNADFEERFPLEAKDYNADEINVAKAALSNMIGGIGYFYGSSRVQGEYNKDPVPYWKAPLFTAVPSRSFFPRGFLWDEGFHNLLISKWDREISMDIIGHWFDLMNWDGWIPREQILGIEARARVPEEFIVQRAQNANPPTLLLTLHSMMSGFKTSVSDDDYNFLVHLWPRLRAWYNWFNTTQIGELPGTYRWRGRDSETKRELNPKSLTSGLDDYPRASHPTVSERHLDLRCWMALASGLMADIADIIEKDPTHFEEQLKYLSDQNIFDNLHWSPSAEAFMDYGLHTDDIELKRLQPNAELVRVVYSEPKEKFVDSSGYVSYFPLFLQLLDPYSPKLKRVLKDLKRPDLLWTPFGLRSLAKTSPFYMKHNTEHDPPYWRGSIWINMNFLAVRSLHYYSTVNGPSQTLAKELYEELRKNVIDNIIKEYKRSGYLWEHYNDRTGRGEGSQPFTGWSALVVLMMSEAY